MAAVEAPDVVAFDSSSAAGTPPSSPRVAPFASAPVSPSRSFDAVPFYWEESPGTPKQLQLHSNDFNFDLGRPPTNAAATADELFDGGVIRPLKPPPRLQPVPAASSPKSPKSPGALRRLSPKARAKKPDDFDPFERALVEATRGRAVAGGSRPRAARSLSPLRGVSSGFHAKPGADTGGGEATVGRSGSWKWKLKELFLFRSRSEGRVTGNRNRDVLRKYSEGPRVPRDPSAAEDVRNSSFRSTESSGSMRQVVARDGGGSVGGSSRREVSAHELHYTTKRAVSQEQKRKTFLPYRQGLLGCIGFTPTLPVHDLAKSFASIGDHRS